MATFYTGLRSSDILGLEVKDIDLEDRIFSYYSPKRKVHRRIAFHEELVPILQGRMDEEGRLIWFEDIVNMSRVFKRYMEQLKLGDKNYSLRTFRKTFQTLASAYDMEQAVVDELVGYEHTKTSHKYYVRISIQKQQNELKKFRRPGKGDVY